MDLSKYDFLDFGSSKGGSLRIGPRLGGKSGLGIDSNLEKVKKTVSKGYDCMHGDLTKLDFPDKRVNFTIISHTLEHLRSVDAVEKVLQSAIKASRQFVFFQGPWFDSDAQLARCGFKLYWSDWTGHPTHVTCPMLMDIFKKLNINDYTLLAGKPILNSDHPAIHNIDAKKDLFEFAHGTEPEKQSFVFPFQVFTEVAGFIWLEKNLDRASFMQVKRGYAVIKTIIPIPPRPKTIELQPPRQLPLAKADGLKGLGMPIRNDQEKTGD